MATYTQVYDMMYFLLLLYYKTVYSCLSKAMLIHYIADLRYKHIKEVRRNLDTDMSDVIFRRALLAQHESLFSSAYSFHRKALLWQPQPYQDSLCD